MNEQDSPATTEELTRRRWFLRLGEMAALAGFSGLVPEIAAGLLGSEQQPAGLPPGLHTPSSPHLIQALTTHANPPGTEAQVNASSFRPSAASAMARWESNVGCSFGSRRSSEKCCRAATNAAPIPVAPPEMKMARPARSGLRARSSLHSANAFLRCGTLYDIDVAPSQSWAPRTESRHGHACQCVQALPNNWHQK